MKNCYLNWFEECDFNHGDVVARQIQAHDVRRGWIRTGPVHSKHVQQVVAEVQVQVGQGADGVEGGKV